MDLCKFSCSCALLLTATLVGSLEAAGYGRPMAQQWPWNSYTTTTASPGSEILSTVTPTTTPAPPPPPPEFNINFLRPDNTNNDDDSLMVVDPATNEQYWIPRQTFVERFAGQQNSQITQQQQSQQAPLPSLNPGGIQPTVRCGHYFSRACNNNNNINRQQQLPPQITQEQMETAASTFPVRLPLFENNRVFLPQPEPSFVENELYNNYNRLYNNYYGVQEVYPYPTINTDYFNQGVNSQLMKLLFRKFDPETAIYSYASIQNPCPNGQCGAPTRVNSYSNNDNNDRRDRPTIRPRRPKLTSTWIPIIYRTSTEKALISSDEVVRTTTEPQTSYFTTTEAPLTTTSGDESGEVFTTPQTGETAEKIEQTVVDYPEVGAEESK